MHPDQGTQPLLIKYLLTSEPLSIQVHPGPTSEDPAAGSGKAECWYVVEAAEGARVGLGFARHVSETEVREAALNGSIEGLLAWYPVNAGDFVYVPAGVVHAIGAGLTIVEVQQNSDMAYRLYDYGRNRAVHVDDALAVAELVPAEPSYIATAASSADEILLSSPEFSVARISTSVGAQWMEERTRWVVPVDGSAIAGDQTAIRGEALLVAPGDKLQLGPDTVAIIAAEGEFEV